MATLTNPIEPQNIVDRFTDYVVTTANTGISWGTDAFPFTECDFTEIFGGTISGDAINISGTNITDIGTDTLITAQDIYDVLIGESTRYTNIRLITAQLFVTGNGGNSGTRPTQGTIFNETRIAHLTTAYTQPTLSAVRDDVYKDNQATTGGLEVMMGNMRAAYENARDTNAGTWITSVCHASCHSNCHSSRGRR